MHIFRRVTCYFRNDFFVSSLSALAIDALEFRLKCLFSRRRAKLHVATFFVTCIQCLHKRKTTCIKTFVDSISLLICSSKTENAPFFTNKCVIPGNFYVTIMLVMPYYSNAHCTVTVRILPFTTDNALDLKIRTGVDLHSVRTPCGKSHVCSMQISACGNLLTAVKTL